MRVTIGTKVTNPMPDGLKWPAIAVTEPYDSTTTVIDRTTGLPVEITVTRADFISQRTAKDGTVYSHFGPEVVTYGWKNVATPRFSNIVGLDVTEEGAILDLDEVMQAHEASQSAWQASQFAARRGATAAADL